jgi:hypothetical protein
MSKQEYDSIIEVCLAYRKNKKTAIAVYGLKYFLLQVHSKIINTEICFISIGTNKIL